jgi:hypothetical protein
MNRALTKDEWHKALAEDWSKAIQDTYEAEIKAAVEAEREACAQVCDSLPFLNGTQCATAIRMRGEAK